MLQFDVEAVVLCDDVRQEMTGKYILIGVYSGNILVSALPLNLVLSAWIQIKPHVIGMQKIKFRLVGPNSTVLVEGGVQFDIKDLSSSAALGVVGLPIQAQQTGPVTLEIADDGDGEWQSVKTIDLALASHSQPVAMAGS